MPPIEEKKKPRPKDVFGRLLPTEEQFEVLKNAPRSVSSAIFLISGNHYGGLFSLPGSFKLCAFSIVDLIVGEY